ncbi:hypothetical protein AHMF7616_02948 [Adhaeribacter pallidiroseus]|uniref:Acyltransferase 3 domain-containing protein n=2 Tax=Adhaeribacter pallidiroseus TaxID=2072847 RepID=A0A369QL08_9BACT|nr:hypothetical protein AHMF7616_02948 [Adhaeribacter pallidiroseus]
MMLLLGHSFYLSSAEKNISYPQYVKKRFQRLVVPAWTFLTLFFILFYFVAVATGQKYYFSGAKIMQSYALTNGIGYVWIIKISFLVALLSPFILKISKRVKSNLLYYLLIAGSYAGYALLLYVHDALPVVYKALDNINHYLDGVARTLYAEVIIYGVSYSFIVALGIRLTKLSQREVTGACLGFLGLFLFLSYQNDFSTVQAFKYPPQLYYLSYGLFVSFLLYRLLDYTFFKKFGNSQLIIFLSRNSAWVYFWHIIFVYYIRLFGASLPSYLATTSSGRFFFIMAGALLVTYSHQQIKELRQSYEDKAILPAGTPMPHASNI